MRRVHGLQVVIAMSFGIGLVACSHATGTVNGTLAMVGGPPGFESPMPGYVLISGPEERTVDVGTDGSFTISLPPGSYTVVGGSPQFGGGDAVCRAHEDVVVTADTTTTVTVACDIP